MIIDSSAIIAIIGREPGSDRLETFLVDAADPKIGAPTRLETGMVAVGRWGSRGNVLLTSVLQRGGVTVVPFTEDHAEVALDAFQRFGKGRHRAGLNFGDCLTYATAYVAREPLLCTGDDFRHTDLDLVS